MDKYQILDPSRKNQLQKYQGKNNCLQSNSLPEKNSLSKDQQSQTAAQRTMMTDGCANTKTADRTPEGHLPWQSALFTWLEYLKPSGHHTFSKKDVIQLKSSELASGSYWRAADVLCREGLKKQDGLVQRTLDQRWEREKYSNTAKTLVRRSRLSSLCTACYRIKSS